MEIRPLRSLSPAPLGHRLGARRIDGGGAEVQDVSRAQCAPAIAFPPTVCRECRTLAGTFKYIDIDSGGADVAREPRTTRRSSPAPCLQRVTGGHGESRSRGAER
ncbi:hypothetical protein NDU88_004485 [Pleurodeles waltl]|uniref:Uncharacterized protein n=1 Tax=Pleurodeles waltl TaxID=8319 RepID=A0AAV7TSP5_PLEWA|nr:hypothetical protein NDU88_004485 [Pleurodeles waltl]